MIKITITLSRIVQNNNVKSNERYDVEKVGQHERPIVIRPMQRYYRFIDETDESDREKNVMKRL